MRTTLGGGEPPPLELVILKVVQRCNLDCSYCYVYNRGDNSWAERPTVIQDEVLDTLGRRIAEHCELTAMSRFTVELHGGEPLLLGVQRMRRLLTRILTAAAPIRPRFILQTNGTLLTVEWLDLFAEFNLSFGVSLDGPPEVADQFRIYRKTRGGSTQDVLDRLSVLRRDRPASFENLFGGCLCVVNPALDGGRVVDWFLENGITSFDFLLPDGNRVNLPDSWVGAEPYRRFLLEACERWLQLDSSNVHVRKFELMIIGLLGGDVALDSLGGDLSRVCVVESDGSIGVNDVARMCGGVMSRDLITILDQPLSAHRQAYELPSTQEPSEICRTCDMFAACGGGYLPHRFDGSGFANPSLYCDALFALGTRLHRHLMETVPRKALVGSHSGDRV